MLVKGTLGKKCIETWINRILNILFDEQGIADIFSKILIAESCVGAY